MFVEDILNAAREQQRNDYDDGHWPDADEPGELPVDLEDVED